MSNDGLWLMPPNFRPASVQKTVDRYIPSLAYRIPPLPGPLLPGPLIFGSTIPLRMSF
jgi:hypothetical protein